MTMSREMGCAESLTQPKLAEQRPEYMPRLYSAGKPVLTAATGAAGQKTRPRGRKDGIDPQYAAVMAQELAGLQSHASHETSAPATDDPANARADAASTESPGALGTDYDASAGCRRTDRAPAASGAREAEPSRATPTADERSPFFADSEFPVDELFFSPFRDCPFQSPGHPSSPRESVRRPHALSPQEPAPESHYATTPTEPTLPTQSEQAFPPSGAQVALAKPSSPALESILQRARRGDRTVLPKLKKAFDESPEWIDLIGALTKQTRECQLSLFAGSDPVEKEAVLCTLNQLRTTRGADMPGFPGFTASRA